MTSWKSRNIDLGVALAHTTRISISEKDEECWPATSDHTLNAYAASHCALQKLESDGPIAQTLEQVHWLRKQRPVLGFKRFDHAAVTICGIELLHKIQKHQF